MRNSAPRARAKSRALRSKVKKGCRRIASTLYRGVNRCSSSSTTTSNGLRLSWTVSHTARSRTRSYSWRYTLPAPANASPSNVRMSVLQLGRQSAGRFGNNLQAACDSVDRPHICEELFKRRPADEGKGKFDVEANISQPRNRRIRRHRLNPPWRRGRRAA